MPPRPLDVFGFVRLASDLGFDLVQIDDNLPLHLMDGSGLDALRSFCAERGVDTEVGIRGSGTAHMERSLEVASRLGSPFLRVLLDSGDDRPPVGECARRLRAILPACARRGMTIAIENHDRLRVEELLEVMRLAGGKGVGVCLDTVNSFGCLEDPRRVIEALAPHVVNLHLKDFVVRRIQGGMGFEIAGAPAGEGMLGAAGVVERLRGEGRPFSATLELWPPRQADPGRTVELEQEWIRSSLRNLRRMAALALP
jgi:sugar phosphate isomerase/epimerase